MLVGDGEDDLLEVNGVHGKVIEVWVRWCECRTGLGVALYRWEQEVRRARIMVN